MRSVRARARRWRRRITPCGEGSRWGGWGRHWAGTWWTRSACRTSSGDGSRSLPWKVILSSMEGNRLRWILITAIAPIAWGSSYYVTRHLLPADAPLWGGVLRALPAGLIVLLIARRLPTGAWWW